MADQNLTDDELAQVRDIAELRQQADQLRADNTIDLLDADEAMHAARIAAEAAEAATWDGTLHIDPTKAAALRASLGKG